MCNCRVFNLLFLLRTRETWCLTLLSSCARHLSAPPAQERKQKQEQSAQFEREAVAARESARQREADVEAARRQSADARFGAEEAARHAAAALRTAEAERTRALAELRVRTVLPCDMRCDVCDTRVGWWRFEVEERVVVSGVSCC